MSPTSYQAAPPRINLVFRDLGRPAERAGVAKSYSAAGGRSRVFCHIRGIWNVMCRDAETGGRGMKVAVIGGTGLAGRYVVEALRRGRHEVVVAARSTGVDLTTGEGLDGALAGVAAVVDVTNHQEATEVEAARRVFER